MQARKRMMTPNITSRTNHHVKISRKISKQEKPKLSHLISSAPLESTKHQAKTSHTWPDSMSRWWKMTQALKEDLSIYDAQRTPITVKRPWKTKIFRPDLSRCSDIARFPKETNRQLGLSTENQFSSHLTFTHNDPILLRWLRDHPVIRSD